MRALGPLFYPPGKQHRIPGDAEETELQACNAATTKMYAQEPSTIQCSLQLKYPWAKTSLVKAWNREMERKHPRSITVEERAFSMRRILQDVAVRIGQLSVQTHNDAQFFLGKRVSRCQGPVQFLAAYGIIIKNTRKKPNNNRKNVRGKESFGRLIRVGKGKASSYRICSTVAERMRATQRLKSMVVASAVLENLMRRARESSDLLLLRRHMLAAMIALNKIKAPMLRTTATNYNMSWTVRGVCCTGLAQAGRTLSAKGRTVRELMGIFPDANQRIIQVARHLFGSQHQAEAAHITDLFRRLQYRGKPEHFSMWLCFFASVQLDNVPPSSLTANRSVLDKLMQDIRAQKKLGLDSPVPVSNLS